MIELRPFQRRFLARAFAPGIDRAALSMPRGNGKTTLAAWILARCLTPGDPWNVPGWEYVLTSASLKQSRHVYRPLREALEPRGGYRFIDTDTRRGITHLASNTRLEVIGSKGKTAMGLVRCPLVVCEEPGAWETVGGELMNDAIEGALGKPDSPLRIIYIGTLAPSTGGWWHDLVNGGSRGSTFVMNYQGDHGTWDKWPTIAKANPLVWRYAESRRKLLDLRDEARADTRLKASFLSYRLNLPTPDEARVLLTVPEWERVLAREVPDRNGARPVVGIDLGHNRAWSAAVAMWPGGRTEALALAPGVPSIARQERRDLVPAGTYARLVESGALLLARDREVPRPRQLVDAVVGRWGLPYCVVCDKLKVPTLRSDFSDVGFPAPLVVRRGLWSEANADIFAFRRLAKDGPMAVEGRSRGLLTASLAASMVGPDKHGNLRMEKRGSNNVGRDDVAAAAVLAAGEHVRRPPPRPLRSAIIR